MSLKKRLRRMMRRRRVTIRPKLKPVTIDTFTRGCRAIGLDADRVIRGEVSFSDVRDITPDEARAFVEITLENPGVVDIGGMTHNGLQEVMGSIVAFFLMKYRTSSEVPTPHLER